MPNLRDQHKRAYRSWITARQRCNNPRKDSYERYGGRGIKCRFSTFEEFIEHIGPCPEGSTLDRIDNSGDYEPGNVRWATPTQQGRNRRSNRLVTYKGVTLSVVEWAEKVELPYYTLLRRFACGWSVERALTQPIRVQKPRIRQE